MMSAWLQNPYGAPSLVGAAVIGSLGVLWLYRKLVTRRALVSLQGKVVLITGASGGIGEALAHAYYRAGCKVIISARRLKELERVKEEVIAQPVENGPSYEPHILEMDVADFAAVPEVIQKAIAFHGRMDVLVNNAGIGYGGFAAKTKVEVYQRVMEVNYLGSVAVTTAVLPHMISNKSGSIIAVSSTAGRVAPPFATAYTASKFAMQAYFDSLRAEVAQHDIHVGVISPHWVKTNITFSSLTADNTQYGKMFALAASGMTAEYLADRIVLQTARQEDDVVVAPIATRYGKHIHVLFPSLSRMLLRQAANEQQGWLIE